VLNEGNYSYKKIFDLIANAIGVKPPSIELKHWLGSLAWKAAMLVGWFSGKTPVVTRETVEAGFRTTTYSNNKIKEKLNLKFIPITDTIRDTAAIYLKSASKIKNRNSG
jgi:hypothetical protein